MADLRQERRGTAAAWVSANTTLLAGEIGYETDTGYLKIGDGSLPWNRLKYVVGPPLSAAQFLSSSAYLTVTATLASAGSILARFRTNWNHTDSAAHVLFDMPNGIGGSISFNKFSDNNLYIGVAMGGDQRIVVGSGSYAFKYGQVHTLVYTWDDSSNAQEVFIDGTSKGTASTAFTFTAPTAAAVGNGSGGGTNFDGSIYDFKVMDRVVSSTEISDYAADVDPVSSSGNFNLRFHRKIEDIWNARTVVPTAVKIVP